jgi:hypothetical protein
MAVLRVSLAGLSFEGARAVLRESVARTPADAVVQIRIEGRVHPAVEAALGAAVLREMAGARNVSVALPRAASRSDFRGWLGEPGI